MLTFDQHNADDLTDETEGLDTAFTNLDYVRLGRDVLTHDPYRGAVEYQMMDAHSGRVGCRGN